jgi:hypothetical protein
MEVGVHWLLVSMQERFEQRLTAGSKPFAHRSWSFKPLCSRYVRPAEPCCQVSCECLCHTHLARADRQTERKWAGHAHHISSHSLREYYSCTMQVVLLWENPVHRSPDPSNRATPGADIVSSGCSVCSLQKSVTMLSARAASRLPRKCEPVHCRRPVLRSVKLFANASKGSSRRNEPSSSLQVTNAQYRCNPGGELLRS